MTQSSFSTYFQHAFVHWFPSRSNILFQRAVRQPASEGFFCRFVTAISPVLIIDACLEFSCAFSIPYFPLWSSFLQSASWCMGRPLVRTCVYGHYVACSALPVCLLSRRCATSVHNTQPRHFWNQHSPSPEALWASDSLMRMYYISIKVNAVLAHSLYFLTF